MAIKRLGAMWPLAMLLLLGDVPAGFVAQMFDIHELARQPFNAAGDSDTTKIKFAVPVEGIYSVLIDILYDENTQGALRGAQLAGGIVPDQWGEPGVSFDVRVVVFDPTAHMEVVKEYKRRPKIISLWQWARQSQDRNLSTTSGGLPTES